VPHRREVERLQRGALVAGAVTEEGDPDPAGALHLGGQRGAADQRRPTADDAVGAQHALAEVGDVHRAAFAAARPGAPAVDLGHHLPDVDAFGDAVPVAAVGAGDRVPLVQVHAHPGGGRFFPGVEVHETGDVAFGELLVHPVFEGPDGPHRPVGGEQAGFVQCTGRFRGNRSCHGIPPLCGAVRHEPLGAALAGGGWISSPRWAAVASTARTSSTRGPWSVRVTVTVWPAPNSNSRSPSRATVPAGTSLLRGWSSGSGSASATPTVVSAPGAMGASTVRGAVSCGANRTATPRGSCRPVGSSCPGMLDSPVAWGSANAQ